MKILLNAPPFSINKAYYKRSKTRTQECRAWGDSILTQLCNYEKEFEEFRNNYNPGKNGIEIHIIWHMPASKLYTKKKVLSKTSMDLSNIEKLLIDLIFDKRFANYGNINLNLNDAFITRLVSEKKSYHKYQIEVLLRVVTLP